MMKKLYQSVRDAVSDIRIFYRIGKVGKEQHEQDDAHDYTDFLVYPVEHIFRDGRDEIGHRNAHEAEHEKSLAAYSAVDVEEIIGVIPPFFVEELFQHPRCEVFHRAAYGYRSDEHERGIFFGQ